MATFGSGLNPALGRTDYSAIQQGANAAAQGILAGGQGIARGIEQAGGAIAAGVEKHFKEQEQMRVMLGELDMIRKSNPDAFKNIDPKIAERMAKGDIKFKEVAPLYAGVMTQQKLDQIALQKEQQKFMNDLQLRGVVADERRAKAALLDAQRAFLPKPREAQFGYEYGANGELVPTKGGPHDPMAVGSPAWKAATEAEEKAALADEKSLEKVAKKNEEAALAEKRAASEIASLDQTHKTIAEAYELSQTGAGGPIEGIGWVASAKNIAGSGKSKELNNLVSTIKASLSISNLRKMREESKTGGAVGNVSDKDLELLGSDVANLDTTLSEPELRKRLVKVGQSVARMKQALAAPALPSGWSIKQ